MPDTMQTVTASELIVGDMVDLSPGEFFREGQPEGSALIDYEYGIVGEITPENPGCILVSFENVGAAGYAPDHVFNIVSRDQLGAAWFARFQD
jgi:hypothetical protein